MCIGHELLPSMLWVGIGGGGGGGRGGGNGSTHWAQQTDNLVVQVEIMDKSTYTLHMASRLP